MPFVIAIACLVIGALIGQAIASRVNQSSEKPIAELLENSTEQSDSSPIHDHTQQHQDEDESLEELKLVLLRLFETLTSTIDDLQVDSTSYAKNLEAQRSSLQNSLNLDDLKKLGDELLQHVSDMHSSNTRYRKQLEAANELVKHQQGELEALQVIAGTDFLTNTHNRAALDEHLRVMINISRRYGNAFSLLVLDIDNFKRINDALGHLAGDTVLKDLANLLKKHSRESDFLARYGGEEFVYILPEMSSDQAQIMGNKLLKQIEEYEFHYAGEDITVTMSGGVSTVVAQTDTNETIFERADNALFKAKEQGRNRIVGG